MNLKDKSFELLYPAGRHMLRDKHAPILSYHSIDNSGSLISVTFDEFKKQMKFLKDNGFRSIPLDEYIASLRDNKPAPSKSFVLTFDDGYHNFLPRVFPILKHYGFTAVIFLATGYIGGSSDWIKERSVPKLKMLTWEDIIRLKEAGISFGAHSVSHPYMTRLHDREMTDEILACQKIIEQKLGNPVTSFCYPYGDYDERVVKIVKEHGFKGACSLDLGVKNDVKSLFTLKRLKIGPDTTLSYFKFIFSGFYDLNLGRKRLFKSIKDGILRHKIR